MFSRLVLPALVFLPLVPLLTPAEPPAASPVAMQSQAPAAPASAGDRYTSGLVGSPHDFTQSEPPASDLCLPCHVAHLAGPPAQLAERQPAATQPLRPYQTLAAELDAASLLCLSCHDGVIASDVFTAAHATQFSSQLGTSGSRGRPLAGHPIGVKYPLSDPKYHPPAAVTSSGRVKLPLGRVQCTSCHDPHNTEDHDGMLVMSNQRSNLCLTCHRL